MNTEDGDGRRRRKTKVCGGDGKAYKGAEGDGRRGSQQDSVPAFVYRGRELRRRATAQQGRPGLLTVRWICLDPRLKKGFAKNARGSGHPQK